MPLDIEIQGLDGVLAALDAFPEQVAARMEEATTRVVLRLIPDLARYPAPPAGSTYRRTGTLGRTWTSATPTFQAMASGFEGRVGNATPYAVYVQSADDQAWMHRGRWPTDEDVLADHAGDIQAEYTAAVEQLANDLNRSGA